MSPGAISLPGVALRRLALQEPQGLGFLQDSGRGSKITEVTWPSLPDTGQTFLYHLQLSKGAQSSVAQPQA